MRQLRRPGNHGRLLGEQHTVWPGTSRSSLEVTFQGTASGPRIDPRVAGLRGEEQEVVPCAPLWCHVSRHSQAPTSDLPSPLDRILYDGRSVPVMGLLWIRSKNFLIGKVESIEELQLYSSVRNLNL